MLLIQFEPFTARLLMEKNFLESDLNLKFKEA